MTHWLSPVERALEGRTSVVEVFFRDDDGGWNDDQLRALLDVFRYHETSIDVAVIPAATSAATAEVIESANVNGRSQVHIHQHGYEHINHQNAGPNSEFGDARPVPTQSYEIAAGRALLINRFSFDAAPIFTPPWNRCCHGLAKRLGSLGFSAISRDATAEPFDIPGLQEIPIHIDWFKKRGGKRIDLIDLGHWIGETIHSMPTVGIMLHHAVMDRSDLEHLSHLLSLLSVSSNARSIMMNEIAARGSSCRS